MKWRKNMHRSYIANFGLHKGRVAVRSTGYFNISTAKSLVQGINVKYCTAIHRKDGYGYAF